MAFESRAPDVPTPGRPASTQRAKVIYILGHPYSGSTLFSLALGGSPEIVNLGEVNFLEHDYQPMTRCLCGETLEHCGFWRNLKAKLDLKQPGGDGPSRFLLSENGEFSAPDRRHKPLIERLKLGLGYPLEKIYPGETLAAYRRKNAVFFQVAYEAAGGRILVDASKSPQRLALLLQIPDVELKVIRLKRDLRGILGSRLKRDRRRRRYVFPISTLYHLLWLLGLNAAIERVYRALPEERKATVRFEEFTEDPAQVLRSLSGFLDTGVDLRRPESRQIALAGQHVYVGNRWAFKNPGGGSVEIRESSRPDELNAFDRSIYRLLSLCVPALRR